jgi:hypothetical protein
MGLLIVGFEVVDINLPSEFKAAIAQATMTQHTGAAKLIAAQQQAQMRLIEASAEAQARLTEGLSNVQLMGAMQAIGIDPLKLKALEALETYAENPHGGGLIGGDVAGAQLFSQVATAALVAPALGAAGVGVPPVPQLSAPTPAGTGVPPTPAPTEAPPPEADPEPPGRSARSRDGCKVSEGRGADRKAGRQAPRRGDLRGLPREDDDPTGSQAGSADGRLNGPRSGRPGSLLPGPPDPDVQDYRIRLLDSRLRCACVDRVVPSGISGV